MTKYDELTDAEQTQVDANHRRDMILIDELRAGIGKLIDEFYRKQMPTWTINRPAEFSFGLVVPSPPPYDLCLWAVSGPDIAGVKQPVKFLRSYQDNPYFEPQGPLGGMGVRSEPVPKESDDEIASRYSKLN